MHKLLLTVLIACTAWVATAQRTSTPPAPSGRTGATTKLTPTSPAPATSPRTTLTPQFTPKSGDIRPETATERSTSSYAPPMNPRSGTSHTEAATERSTNSTTSRPTRPASTRKTVSHYNGSGTARSVPAPAKKVAPLEPVVVHWMTLEEALEKNKVEKRKIF
ncbi:MAG: hypothetical protein ABIO24_07140, partial [Saprospiraceae bacterium]